MKLHPMITKITWTPDTKKVSPLPTLAPSALSDMFKAVAADNVVERCTVYQTREQDGKNLRITFSGLDPELVVARAEREMAEREGSVRTCVHPMDDGYYSTTLFHSEA